MSWPLVNGQDFLTVSMKFSGICVKELDLRMVILMKAFSQIATCEQGHLQPRKPSQRDFPIWNKNTICTVWPHLSLPLQLCSGKAWTNLIWLLVCCGRPKTIYVSESVISVISLACRGGGIGTQEKPSAVRPPGVSGNSRVFGSPTSVKVSAAFYKSLTNYSNFP